MLRAVLTAWLLWSANAGAGELTIPLSFRYELLSRVLAGQLHAQDAAAGTLYRDGRCRYFELDPPRLITHEGRLRFVTPARAALGSDLLGDCRGPHWKGVLESTLVPYLAPGWKLKLRVVDHRLRDKPGGDEVLFGFATELMRAHLPPRLAAFEFDLAPPRDELRALLQASVTDTRMEEASRLLDTLAPGPLVVEQDRLRVPLLLTVPDAWQATRAPSVPVPALDSAAIEALQHHLEQWDAFLVFIVKRAGLDIEEPALRERLFELLIESRHALLSILSGENLPGLADPLRVLFVSVWDELRAILEDAAARGEAGASLLRYALFINAGDALLAIDKTAPGFGVEFSADGLRRLAKSLVPTLSEDPLYYDEAVDPELRRLFRFTPIITPREDTAPRSSLGGALLAWLVRPAEAAAARKLDRWVPTHGELAEYRAAIATLLNRVAKDELTHNAIEARHAPYYRHLLPSTALIESCWHQYERERGKIVTLSSQVGSLGLMQVNPHVWRGFYDVARLRNEVAYNARAGAQILMRYFRQYGIKTAARTGNADHIPRATYAVYNAGPRAALRFLSSKSRRAQRVDKRLWSFYQGFAAGGSADLGTCRVASPG